MPKLADCLTVIAQESPLGAVLQVASTADRKYLATILKKRPLLARGLRFLCEHLAIDVPPDIKGNAEALSELCRVELESRIGSNGIVYVVLMDGNVECFLDTVEAARNFMQFLVGQFHGFWEAIQPTVPDLTKVMPFIPQFQEMLRLLPPTIQPFSSDAAASKGFNSSETLTLDDWRGLPLYNEWEEVSDGYEGDYENALEELRDALTSFLDSTESIRSTLPLLEAKINASFASASNWKPLEDLIGTALCPEFMYMGRDQDRGLEMYKHIGSRRYLNIDPATGDTYKRLSGNDWAKVQPGEAIRFARSIE